MAKNIYFSLEKDVASLGKEVLGGKGYGLATLCSLNIPVPPAFIVTTETCEHYHDNNSVYPNGLGEEIDNNIKKLEEVTGKKFGGLENPLLVSVRSGAAVSMPGMMDTILNLGLNDQTVEALAKKSNNRRFALDSYRRFIQMFSDVAMGVEAHMFEKILEKKKKEVGVELDYELDEKALEEIIVSYKEAYKKERGVDFPQDVKEQLNAGIKAVFDSWNNDRAKSYRRLNNIRGLIGTAVNVQAMVFGNLSENSGTGVVFTRNPNTGENRLYGEYLQNAQGEDVVAGIRTPEAIESLKKKMPKAYSELLDTAKRLETYFKDMQDIEFTVEDQKLYILQTRNGKRNIEAAINIAMELEKEGLLSKEEALLMVDADQIDNLLHPRIKEGFENAVLGKGLPASPGAVTGRISFTTKTAQEYSKNGDSVILVRNETTPEDIEDMAVCDGILTARGGMTSHAAVVGRGMGKCCVVGSKDLLYEDGKTRCKIGQKSFNEGQIITLDGSTGRIIDGKVDTIEPKPSESFNILMKWADELRTMKVRVNADTPEDSKKALELGAEGIGLCRTEHMFFGEDRIDLVRGMILADNTQKRIEFLDKLMPFQKQDFIGIFEAMDNLPVTIRLIDPPLHEFLPRTREDIEEFAKDNDLDFKRLRKTLESMEETNPMLGHRGCRLGVTYPEIVEMQTKAIIEAALQVAKNGITAKPEIEVPLVQNEKELSSILEVMHKVAKEYNYDGFLPATMIELPRACLVAEKLAEHVKVFSFGTNDLTQTTMGISRDDGGRFITNYMKKEIFETDPFQKLDQNGVGQLVKMAVEKGRKVNKNLEIGVCGEHGGDPSSIEFFQKIGLDFISCSTYRLPAARLAAAQAAIRS